MILALRIVPVRVFFSIATVRLKLVLLWAFSASLIRAIVQRTASGLCMISRISVSVASTEMVLVRWYSVSVTRYGLESSGCFGPRVSCAFDRLSANHVNGTSTTITIPTEPLLQNRCYTVHWVFLGVVEGNGAECG